MGKLERTSGSPTRVLTGGLTDRVVPGVRHCATRCAALASDCGWARAGQAADQMRPWPPGGRWSAGRCATAASGYVLASAPSRDQRATACCGHAGGGCGRTATESGPAGDRAGRWAARARGGGGAGRRRCSPLDREVDGLGGVLAVGERGLADLAGRSPAAWLAVAAACQMLPGPAAGVAAVVARADGAQAAAGADHLDLVPARGLRPVEGGVGRGEQLGQLPARPGVQRRDADRDRHAASARRRCAVIGSCAMCARTRSAMRRASGARVCGSSITNSSPPNRPARS